MKVHFSKRDAAEMLLKFHLWLLKAHFMQIARFALLVSSFANSHLNRIIFQQKSFSRSEIAI